MRLQFWLGLIAGVCSALAAYEMHTGQTVASIVIIATAGLLAACAGWRAADFDRRYLPHP